MGRRRRGGDGKEKKGRGWEGEEGEGMGRRRRGGDGKEKKGRGWEGAVPLTLLTWSLMVLTAVSKSQSEKMGCLCSSDSRVANLASSSLVSRLAEGCSARGGEGKGGEGRGEDGSTML